MNGCGFVPPDPICTYWDVDNSAWDLTGCQYAGHSKDGETVICNCSHLTSFGIFFDWQGNADPHEPGIHIHYTIYIGWYLLKSYSSVI